MTGTGSPGFGTSSARHCNFISTAEFHSSSTPNNESQLFPALCISPERRPAAALTLAATLVNVHRRQNSIFANYSSTSWAVLLSPRWHRAIQHNKSFLSSFQELRALFVRSRVSDAEAIGQKKYLPRFNERNCEWKFQMMRFR